jgi:hypothetical protein
MTNPRTPTTSTRTTLLAILLAACGPGIRDPDVDKPSGVPDPLALDLQVLLSEAKTELSRCADPFRERVRLGGPEYGNVDVVIDATGKPNQLMKFHIASISSRFGSAYNLCVRSAMSEPKVVASSYYEARAVLHWRIAPPGA